MKLKILVGLSVMSMASMSIAGGWLSKPGPRIKIANTETLNKRANKANLNDMLEQLGIIETFADKEFSESEINTGIDDAFNTLWANMLPRIKQSMSPEKFEKERDTQHQSFMAQSKEVKPAILKILLPEESPE